MELMLNIRRAVWIIAALLFAAVLLGVGYHFGTQGSDSRTALQPESTADDSLGEGSRQHGDSPAPGARESVSGHPQERLEPSLTDPYLESPSLFEMVSQLVAENELNESDLASTMVVWSVPCRRAAQFADRTGHDQPVFGLSREASQSLGEFCGELAEDMDGDAREYSQAWLEATDEVNPLWDMVERGDLGAAVKAAIETIYRSRNEIEILQALGVIIHLGDLDSPFAGVDREAVVHLFGWRVMSDAALALLCDNLGGCAGNHPLVARHCLQMEWHDGCYRPHDIYHAIEQTQTPIQQTVFWSLLNQTATMRRRLR